jgi:hypothetical protein
LIGPAPLRPVPAADEEAPITAGDKRVDVRLLVRIQTDYLGQLVVQGGLHRFVDPHHGLLGGGPAGVVSGEEVRERELTAKVRWPTGQQQTTGSSAGLVGAVSFRFSKRPAACRVCIPSLR